MPSTNVQPSQKWDMVGITWRGNRLDGIPQGGKAVARFKGGMAKDRQAGVNVYPVVIELPVVVKRYTYNGVTIDVNAIDGHLPISGDADVTGSRYPWEITITLTGVDIQPEPIVFWADATAAGGVIDLNTVERYTGQVSYPTPYAPVPTAEDLDALRSQIAGMSAMQAAAVREVLGSSIEGPTVSKDSATGLITISAISQSTARQVVGETLAAASAGLVVPTVDPASKIVTLNTDALEALLDFGDPIDYVAAYNMSRDAA